MKECHVCLYMCDDEAEICPICGAELLEESEDVRSEAANIEENSEQNEAIINPVLAASVDSPVTAEIFKDILLENGIAYSDNSGGDVMHTGFGGSYFATDVYVDESNLDAAKELYRNLTENEMTFEDFEGFPEDGEE